MDILRGLLDGGTQAVTDELLDVGSAGVRGGGRGRRPVVGARDCGNRAKGYVVCYVGRHICRREGFS